jgi:hypothetical protein
VTMTAYLTDKTLPSDDNRACVVLLTADYYIIKDGLLYHIHAKGKQTITPHIQLVVPPSLREEVMMACHDDTGHFGIARSYETARTRYYWEGLFRDIAHYVKSCAICNTRKNPKHKRRAPVTPMPIVTRPFQRTAIDIVGPLPVTKDGNRYIVVISDGQRLSVSRTQRLR